MELIPVHHLRKAPSSEMEQGAGSDLNSSSDKGTNATDVAPPSRPHLMLVASQRSYLPKLSIS